MEFHGPFLRVPPLLFPCWCGMINPSYSAHCAATPLYGPRRENQRRKKTRYDWRCGSVETCRNAVFRHMAGREVGRAEAARLQSKELWQKSNW